MKSKTIILLTVFLFLVFGFALDSLSQQHSEPPPLHIMYALQYEGCMTGECDQKFLESVGLRGNHNYCAAFVSYNLELADVRNPNIRSARAVDFQTRNSKDARHIIRGTYKVKNGDIIVWTQNASHVGFAIENWDGAEGLTIEGNTSDPNNPDGRGVFIKRRGFHPGNYFRPRYVTPVKSRN